MAFDHKAFLERLTELPGVYRMRDAEGVLLYVGKAKNLKKRVSSYFRAQLSSPRIAHMVAQIAEIEITTTRTEAEALLLESNLIKTLGPRYNILFRDDKSYPYIVLSRAEYPRLGFFRGNPDRRGDYFGPYPSALAVRDSIHLLQKMFRLRTCEDSVFANRSRPCLLYQIKRCSGPCVDAISPAAYGEDIRLASLFLSGRQQEVLQRLESAMQEAAEALAFEQAAVLRDQIQSLRQVQEKQYIASTAGEDVDIVVAVAGNGEYCVNLAMVRGGRHLGDRPLFASNGEGGVPLDILQAFLRQHYAVHPVPSRLLLSPMPAPDELEELASSLAVLAGREIAIGEGRSALHKAWLGMAQQNAALAIAARQQSERQQEERLDALRELLGDWLGENLLRLECFDISHTQGEATVASCVVYEGPGGMKRSDYRRFNINGIQPGDDYAAMRQAVARRYGKLAEGEGRAPDLLLIDGGRGQFNSARAALEEIGVSIPMLGVAKGEARKPGLETLILPDGEGELNLPSNHPALLLIQEVRDEAHRFAVSGHRARRAKARKQSALDDIPGIGPARRKALITRLGGLAGVREASLEQLAQVPGIGPELAEKIHAALH